MNHSLKTRALSFLMAVIMVFGMFPMPTMADETVETTAPVETTPVVSEESVILTSGDDEVTYFTVTFDAQNGTDPVEQSVESGTAVAQPEDPAYEGYTFLGWYFGEEAWDFETPVTEAITLTAAWEEVVVPVAITYAVTFKADNGTEDVVVNVEEGSPVAEPEAPVREGYTFLGWYCGDNLWDFAAEISSEVTLIAGWEAVASEEPTEPEPTESEPTESEHVHTGGTATCKLLAVCECGESYGELADHIPAEDDGDCTTEIVCTVCGEVTTEAAENHTAGEDGICTLCGAQIPMVLTTEEPVTYKGGLQLGMTDCDYYNIIENSKYNLAPGAVEYEYVLNGDDGTRRQVVHVIEVDTKNPDISVMPSFKNISADVDYSDQNNWGSIEVTKHAAHAEENLGKNVIGGMNVSLSWDFTHPYGLLLYEGKVLHDSRSSCAVCGKGHPGGGYLVIKKDGTAELRDAMEPVEETDWMAQTVCFSYIVKDGKNMHTKEDHNAGDGAAPRSVIGIKEDGTLVLMMVDGRLSPYSAGFTNHEMAETMIALGCVDAINCDGGGSSTFITEREGSGELSVKSRFSDGAERQTLTAILVVSEAKATGEFDHAAIKTDVKLVTPGSVVTFDASGADASGAPAPIPEGVTWQMKNPEMGTVENGEFTSNGTLGTATVQMVYNGEVVGEASVDVVIPTSISFDMPSMTAPYNKTISLDVSAKYGNSPVTLKPSDLRFELANDAVGTISGLIFTAVSDVIENPKSAVTVTLVHDEQVTAEGSITLGRASEIVYDFESGAESVANWTLGYKGTYTPENYYFNDTFEVVSADNGKVKNGEYALKVSVDGDSITCMNWCQTKLFGWDLDLKDAVSLSFWLYIPEGSHGLEWDFGSAIPVGLGHEFVHGTGWQYFTVNVADIGANVTNFNEMRLYHSDTNNSDYGYLHNEHPNYYADVTYYLDDITVNYSSAVDDNVAPVIGSASISHDAIDTPVSMKGQVVNANKVTFTAKATDNYSGLDTSSAAIYVDGVRYDASCSDIGLISSGDMILPNGAHVVRFEISDKMGNVSSFYEYYVVLNGTNTSNTITYGPKDPTLTNVGEGSLVWMDLTADAIELVDKVSTVIDLDQNSKWELAHMELAEGFSATYSIDAENNDATITITRAGKVTASGKAVLASMPIRVWKPAFRGTGGNEDANAYRLMAVMSHVEKGILTETDGKSITFGSLELTTMTEWNSTRLTSTSDKTSWHIHDAKPVENAPATCTKNGYEDRTFCEGCNSVVEWGTTISATGHSYETDENGLLKCACGDLFSGTLDGVEYVDGVALAGWIGNSFYRNGEKLTGVQKVTAPDSDEEFYYDFGENGVCESMNKYSGLFYDAESQVYRYAYLGELSTGWKLVNGEWYYFLSSTQAAAVGEYAYAGITYVFEETGRITTGVWVQDSKGWAYYYGPSFHNIGWQTIDDSRYYFKNGYRLTGKHVISGAQGNDWIGHEFAEDGKHMGELKDTGLLNTVDGLFYLENGIAQTGLIFTENNYYYFRSTTRTAVCGTKYTITNTNDLDFMAGTYEFNADGTMVIKNGLQEENGVIYYYVNGSKAAAGLILIDGNYYYVRSNCQAVTNATYYCQNNNDLLPVANYTFGADGKMIDPPAEEEEPDVTKNGLVSENGSLYYYEDGAKVYAGLILIDGDYYYIRSNCEAVVGRTYYCQKTNDLLPVANYTFGADGKMEIKNGLISENDGLYYYVNGVKTSAGLIEINGAYYYIRTSGQAVVGTTYYCQNNHDIMPNSVYEFDQDGKMINPPAKEEEPDEAKNGLVSENGGLYYYVDGVKTAAGLIKVDGAYYYIRSNGQAVTGRTYYCQNNNGLAPNANYEFDAEGKMINIPSILEQPDSSKNGLVSENGGLYYYVDGVKTAAGMIEIDGAYYYVRSNGQAVVGMTYYCQNNNGLLPNSVYEFDQDGRIVR